MTRTPLFDSLKQYSDRNKGYFRIPGHRFERGIPQQFIDFAGRNIFRIDVTETPMTDDLHKPKNIIADSQKMTAEAFGADRSFYLINGTSCGNESMIMAVAGEDTDGTPDTILIPRNAHKSVLAGLIISGAEPVYTQPHYIEEIGIMGVLNPGTVSKELSAQPDLKAVFVVSPSYHGICSDLEQIADAAHSSGIPLLVDEAHGAHLYFNISLPSGALSCGADACAQSLHKTAGALTQASLLHVGRGALDSNRINLARLDSALRLTMSTSPSYILMSSLELARNDLELHGEDYWDRTIKLAEKTRRRINETTAFRCPGIDELKAAGVFDVDPTRL
ncbi:MAG TPA: arginine decarboxylase, partial [Spirochaeta sp.]|nr:arginine decarboxylase [Spirochaeta sp.]